MKEKSAAPQKPSKKSGFSRVVKWSLWLFGTILATIFFLALLVFLLPHFVSTQWTKEKVELYATQTIQRPVHVQNLSWTWKDGILLENLQIGDDPSFSENPIISLKRFFLSINFRQLIKQRLVVLLELDGAHINLIKKKNGASNLESLLSSISQPAESPSEPGQKSSPSTTILPPPIHDIQARLSINNVVLKMVDREQNRTFLVHDASFLLNAPSLVHEPIDLSFSAREQMDGNPLPPIQVTAKVVDLINKDASINIGGLSADIKGKLPGMEISLLGSASKRGIHGKIRLDLEPLRKGLAPFLSPPPPQMSGRMDLEMTASVDEKGHEDPITYDLKIDGHQLKISGGPLAEKEVGPLDLLVTNKGILRHKEGMLDIRAGVIQIQNGSRISFKGLIRGLEKPPFTVDLLADHIALNLQELFLLARAFVPPGVSLNEGKKQTDGHAKLVVRNATLKGTVPTGSSHLKWDSLEVGLPFSEARLPTGIATGEGLKVKVGKGEIDMSSFFPTRAELTAGLSLDACHLKGKDEIFLKGLHSRRFHILANNLSLSRKSLLGITGKINLTESFFIEKFTALKKITGSKILHTMNIALTLPPSHSLHATTVTLGISTPSLTLKNLLSDPVKTPFTMETKIKGFQFSKGKSYRADVKESEVTVSAGKIVEAHLKAHIVDSGLKKLQADGNMTLDLAKAFALFPPSIRTSIGLRSKVAGKIAVAWNYRGRRPTPVEIGRFSNGKITLKEKLPAAGFVEMAKVTTQLTDIRLNMPLGKQKRVKIKTINTSKPLKLSLKQGLKQTEFEGEVDFEGMLGLPASTKKGQPVRGVLSFSGALNNLEALTLSQKLKIEPLGLTQSLSASLEGIDRFLGGTGQPLSVKALKRLKGALEASIKADFHPELLSTIQTLSVQELDLDGTIEAAAGINFDGKGEMVGRLGIKSPHLNMGLKERLNIKNLKINLDLEKKLRILSQKDTDRADSATSPYLSVKVLKPIFSSQTTSGSRFTSSENFPMGNHRVPFSAKPALAFDSLHMKMDPFPLNLSDFVLQLHLEDSLPSIDSFQFDVFGGTSVGSISITREGKSPKDLFMVGMNCSFTGIDAAKMAPRLAEAGSHETELAGSISVRVPVSGNPDAAINNLSGSIRLTHIGSKTLEGILYALDPSESNEMIRKQRALLRQGTPLWITAEIRSGNFSLSGEMLIKGARIALPTLQRLNITALPIRKKLKKAFSSFGPVVNALKVVSSNTILIDKGNFELIQTSLSGGVD